MVAQGKKNGLKIPIRSNNNKKKNKLKIKAKI